MGTIPYRMPTTSDIRLGHVLGLPVIREGRLLGHVERALLRRDGLALRGLTLRRGLGGARWTEAADIRVLGEVSVIVSATPGRIPRDAEFSLRLVKDSAGLTLGWVTDAFVHPVSCRITALEISLGPAEELRCGRMLTRSWTVDPRSGQVLIPCGCVLEASTSRR